MCRVVQVIDMKKSFTVLGILILIYGISLAMVANFTFGTVSVLIIGAGVLLWGIFYDIICKYTQIGIYKWIKRGIYTICCLEIVFLGFIFAEGISDSCDYKEDVVMVLGSGIRGEEISYALKYRLDKAIEYNEKNPDALIVVTGGRGPQESVTEAYAMEKYLVGNGIDKDIIVKEEKSTSTTENMRFSKDILDGIYGKNYKIVVITNNFHIYRAERTAKNEGFSDVSTLHCATPFYDAIPAYLRETLAVVKYWLIG